MIVTGRNCAVGALAEDGWNTNAAARWSAKEAIKKEADFMPYQAGLRSETNERLRHHSLFTGEAGYKSCREVS